MQGCPSPVCSSVPAMSTHILCKACEFVSASKSVGTHGQSVSKGTLLALDVTVLCNLLASETCLRCACCVALMSLGSL